MRYTIVYQNTHGEDGLISWLGETTRTYQQAVALARAVCNELSDDMPNMTFFVLMHQFEWITDYKK